MNNDAILFWNNIALDAVANDHTGSAQSVNQRGPTRTARALAIVHLAMFDAFNSIARSFTPYLKNLPQAPTGASSGAAIAKSEFDTLAVLYPGQKTIFTTALNNFLATLPSGSPRDQGISVGADIAKRILATRNNGRFYGKDEITFTLNSDEFNGVNKDADGTVRPKRTRSFNSFTQALLENARSRIYLGIHYQFDAYEGADAGIKIANYIFNNFLKPL
jgi:Vanadium chloroperoxidase N-terminal domain